eukprot:10496187-Alexandrium_andersonii.AAC.1
MPVSWPWTRGLPSSTPPGAWPLTRPEPISPTLLRTSTLGIPDRRHTSGGMLVARSTRCCPLQASTRAARWQPWPMLWPPGPSCR